MQDLADDQTVQVDVSTHYDMGITDNSRGGNASVWKLKYQERQWQVITMEEQDSGTSTLLT